MVKWEGGDVNRTKRPGWVGVIITDCGSSGLGWDGSGECRKEMGSERGIQTIREWYVAHQRNKPLGMACQTVPGRSCCVGVSKVYYRDIACCRL